MQYKYFYSFLLAIKFTLNRRYLRIIVHLTIHMHKIRILVINSYKFYENTLRVLRFCLEWRINFLILQQNYLFSAFDIYMLTHMRYLFIWVNVKVKIKRLLVYNSVIKIVYSKINYSIAFISIAKTPFRLGSRTRRAFLVENEIFREEEQWSFITRNLPPCELKANQPLPAAFVTRQMQISRILSRGKINPAQ